VIVSVADPALLLAVIVAARPGLDCDPGSPLPLTVPVPLWLSVRVK